VYNSAVVNQSTMPGATNVVNPKDLVAITSAYMKNVSNVTISPSWGTTLTETEQDKIKKVLTDFYQYIIKICNIYSTPDITTLPDNFSITDTEKNWWINLTAFAILEEALSTPSINTQAGITLIDVMTAFDEIQKEFTSTYSATMNSFKNIEQLIGQTYDTRYTSILNNVIDSFNSSYVYPFNQVVKGGLSAASLIGDVKTVMTLFDNVTTPNHLQLGPYF